MLYTSFVKLSGDVVVVLLCLLCLFDSFCCILFKRLSKFIHPLLVHRIQPENITLNIHKMPVYGYVPIRRYHTALLLISIDFLEAFVS